MLDYHITIHTWPTRASSPKPPVQNLSFSTYGPNNQDLALQAGYLRTLDDAYIQSLPNGEVISFKARAADSEITSSRDSQLLWGRTFSNPVYVLLPLFGDYLCESGACATCHLNSPLTSISQCRRL
jgi:serine/threonine-protein kinase/endoribonuclease IRE1